MKTIILVFTLIIACGGTYKINKYATKNEGHQVIMKDEEYKDLEVKIIKDTATWVDGKIYQFIKVIVHVKPIPKGIKISNIKQYASGSGIISIGNFNFSDTTVLRLNPIMMLSEEEGLFLLDDFDNYTETTVSVLYSKMYSINNNSNLQEDFFLKTIEVNFDEIRNKKISKKYPKANKFWYNKWEKKNPLFFKRNRKDFQERKIIPIKQYYYNNK